MLQCLDIVFIAYLAYPSSCDVFSVYLNYHLHYSLLQYLCLSVSGLLLVKISFEKIACIFFVIMLTFHKHQSQHCIAVTFRLVWTPITPNNTTALEVTLFNTDSHFQEVIKCKKWSDP